MICRTVEEIERAAQTEPCEHGDRLSECERCALTPAEIRSIAALLGPGYRDQKQVGRAAA